MEPRDYNYYEANAADISLEDITSSKHNAQLLRRLCDGDWRSCAKELTLGRVGGWATHFHIGEGDDLGWLGYFIGNSEYLRALNIHYLPEDERGEQQIDAFMDGLARNQSIRTLGLNSLGDYGSTATLRVLGNLTQLEKIVIHNNNLDHNGCSALGTLLQSGFSKLEMLHLQFTNIDDDGVAALAIGLRSIGPSLKTLGLPDNSIGNEGLSTLVAALESCTSLERLDLSHNDFSLAAVGLRTLSDWLQTVVLNLDGLYLQGCDINDEGLQAFAEGAVNHCEDLDLSANPLMASGLRVLSTSLQSESCCVESLLFGWMNIGDDIAEILARGLVGNNTLRCLHLRVECEDEGDIAITPVGWSAFSIALCDTSSVNNTYLSNHTIQELWHDSHDFDEDEDIDESVVLYLQLNKEHPEHAARCKILMNHTHLDMTHLLQWELKFLPLAVRWFERAKSCTTLSIDDYNHTDFRRRVLDESEGVFQSRILTSVYEFVRGMPKKVLERRDELALVAAYDHKIAIVEEENQRIRNEKKRLREDVEERDRKIAKLEEESKRLRESWSH